MEERYALYVVLVIALVGGITIFASGNNDNALTGYAIHTTSIDNTNQARLIYYQERQSNGDRIFHVETQQEITDLLVYQWKYGTLRQTLSAQELGLLEQYDQGYRANFVEEGYDFNDHKGTVYTVRALLPNGKLSSMQRFDKGSVKAYFKEPLSAVSKQYGTYTHQ